MVTNLDLCELTDLKPIKRNRSRMSASGNDLVSSFKNRSRRSLRCPFFKAFLVTSNVPEIYMQEFWATATLKTFSSSDLIGLYHKRNVAYAYLMWEDFVYQVEHKNQKKSNEMYYPRFTKAIIYHFMRTKSSSDTSITPPTAAASPRLTASTKGKQIAKASKDKSLSALSEVAMTKAQQLKLLTKRSKQQTHISQPSGSGSDEGTSSKPGVP
nr:hypothetical protein [Tanacetum cinerariifolium]